MKPLITPNCHSKSEQWGNQTILKWAAVALAGTVMNRTTFRFALVPMAPVTHVFSITTNLCYLAFFCTLVRSHVRAGKISNEAFQYVMKGKGRQLLACAGVSDSIAFTAMPLFARQLPGSIIPISAQAMLPLSMLFSYIFLGRRYDNRQVQGVLLVIAGVAIFSYPKVIQEKDGLGTFGSSTDFICTMLGLMGCYVFVSASLVLKEKCFRQFQAEYPSKSLDRDLVNLTEALWQGMILWLLWPFNFMYLTPLSVQEYFTVCKGIFTDPSEFAVIGIYWTAHVFYLMTTTLMLDKQSATVSVIVQAIAVPLTSLLFCFNWPRLGGESLHALTIVGLVVVCIGFLTYEHVNVLKKRT